MMDVGQIQMKLDSEKQAFLDDLRPKYIMPSLLKYKVITTSEGNDILSEVKPKDQVEKLFSILTKKSPHIFPYFIKALNVDLDGDKTYPWLAEKLEQTHNLSNKANSALINGNIPFPINHLVQRPEKLFKIRETLIDVAQNKSRHWVVLFGPIGSGKTVLAAESLRNNALAEQYFAGGIYWINVGDSKDDEALWLKMKRLLKMMDFSGELHPSETMYDLTLMLKKEVCRKQKMLLVLDDVWHGNAIKAFDIGCPILVTTKNKKVLDKVTSYCTDIECKDDFQPAEILELLAKYVNCEPEELPQVATDVCLKCKGSPLVTSLIGGKMANVGKNKNAWEALNDKLGEHGMGTIRKKYYSGDTNRDLSKIVNLCLEPIQEYKDYYLDFLIFIKDIPVPNKVLEILWDKEDFDVQHIMFELSNRCFVQWERSEEDDNSYSYTSHDLYLETLEADVKDLWGEKKKRHKKLVDKVLQLSIKEDGKIDLNQLPKGYLPYTIGYHLYQAGEHEMLRKLYLDLPFIEQKIHLTGVVRDILSDYDHYRCCFNDEDEVETFKSFIQRNYVALTQKKCDIIQLALFEPENSNVYKIACEAARKLSTKNIYYNWCNKDNSTLHLFHDFKSPNFKNLGHAVINEDASRIAVVDCSLHIAQVYNSDGEILQELHGHSNVINCCSFNSIGDRLITASEDTTVRIFKISESLTSSGNYSGKRLSATTVNLNSEVKDDSMITFTEHENPVLCCAFSPDDQFIISCDIEKTYVWYESGLGWIIRYQKQPPNPKFPFSFCCFNNSGSMFATATAYNTIQVWDFDTGEEKATLVRDNLNVDICFSPDGTHLLSIYDNVVTEWDIESGQKTFDISTGPGKDYVLCSICLNERYIACGTTKGSVIIISRDTNTVVNILRGHNRDVINVMFSKDGKRLFSASSKAYVLHDTSHFTDLPLISFEGNLSAACVNEDLVVASSNYFNSVEVRKGLEGKLVSTSSPEENKITACCLSNDCLLVVYGTKSGNVKIFNIAAKEILEFAPKHAGQVNYILYSKNDDNFFTCSEDKNVHIWRPGKNTLILKGHTQSVLMCVQFQKSKKLVSCSKDGSLRVWNSESGELILPIAEGHGNQDVRFCDISRHEDLLASASADESIKIWNALNGELKKTFRVSKDINSAVRCCRFSPFSEILISGHDNGKLVLWHLLGTQSCRILTTHDSVVYDIRFSEYGPAQFLSLSSGIKLWSNSAQLLQTVLLPSSYMGVDPPCLWVANNFQVMVIIHNSILYILKGFDPIGQ